VRGRTRFVGPQGCENGVGHATAEQKQRLGAGLACGEKLLDVAPGPIPRVWVRAIMCSARFAVRLPPRLSRTFPAVLPDHTGIGAVPVKGA